MKNQLTPRYEDFQIFSIWGKYIKHWPWFVLSTILCCGLAFLYMKATPKSYKRTASVLITDDSKPDITAAFSERNQFYKVNANVHNEIEAFKSPQSAEEVVKRLKLNTTYVMRDRLKQVDLYTQSPIIATFPDVLELGPVSFQVELLPDSMVILSNFVQKTDKIYQNIKTKLNVLTSTPIGNIVISPSLYYSSNQYQMPIEVTKNDIEEVALGYANTLTVSLSSKENTVIAVEMEDVSVQRAEDFLNTLITVYAENCLAEKNKATITTLKFINERLPLIEQELKSIDNKLEQYKSQNLLTDTRDAASLYRKESSEYSGKVLEIRNQITIAKYIQEYLNDNSKTSDLLPTNTGVNNAAVESSISQYNTLLLKRNGLVANSGDKNPVIADLNNSLYSLRQSIIQTVDNLAATLNLQLAGLQSQEDRLTINIASNPGQEKQMISIQREQNIKESLYLYLLQKREENEMALIVTTTNSRVISPPSGSNAPVKPQKIKILMIVLVMGIGIPGGVIWGRDTFNTTIRNKKDISNLTIPLLGIIPQVKKKEKKGEPLVQEHGRDMVNESFRIVRTNLDFACMKNTKVIQFTSLEPGAGKTFMAVNLAMSFALAGKKIVLLDLDLRTATLSRMVEYPELGISNMLGKMVMDERFFIEKDYFYPGFDIIPVGPIPANPSELLMNDHLKALIEKLKTTYDYVFIDSTPVDLVADAAIVGKLAELSIFVVRENFTDRRKLPELEDMYHSGNYNNMRIVLNGSSAEVPTNKYHAYYNKKITHATMLPKSTSDALSENSGYLTEGTIRKK